MITKVSGRWGTIRQGSTKVSRMLMWLAMKTAGAASPRTKESPSIAKRPPTASRARTVARLLSIQRASS